MGSLKDYETGRIEGEMEGLRKATVYLLAIREALGKVRGRLVKRDGDLEAAIEWADHGGAWIQEQHEIIRDGESSWDEEDYSK
jgi:hypothetical protein